MIQMLFLLECDECKSLGLAKTRHPAQELVDFACDMEHLLSTFDLAGWANSGTEGHMCPDCWDNLLRLTPQQQDELGLFIPNRLLADDEYCPF